MTAQLVTDALVMAIWRRGKSDALLGAILPVPMPTFARVNQQIFWMHEHASKRMQHKGRNSRSSMPQGIATCADFRTVRLTVLHAEFRLS